MVVNNQGSVLQSLTKLFLDLWTFSCCLFTLKGEFPQVEGLRKRNMSFMTLLGQNFVANPPFKVNK